MKKTLIVGLELEPRAAGWKAQTNPLSYDGTQFASLVTIVSWKGELSLQEEKRK